MSFAGMQLGDHLCLPVGDDRDRVEATAEFVSEGLGRGMRVVVFADTESPARLCELLERRVPGFVGAKATARVQVASCADVHLAGGVFDPERMMAGFTAVWAEARRAGFRGIWVFVDMSWALRDMPGVEALIDYEAAANSVFAEGWMAAVCCYDRRRFTSTRLAAASCAHPQTPGGASLRFTATHDPVGIRLKGEIDGTNHAAFEALMAALVPLHGSVTIDASAARFVDADAARLLVRTIADRRPKPTVVIATPILSRLLCLVDALI